MRISHYAAPEMKFEISSRNTNTGMLRKKTPLLGLGEIIWISNMDLQVHFHVRTRVDAVGSATGMV